ncbi:MAG: RNA-dependent ATPase [Chaenotheca gracillima]|nr:MAG: RNA-dependent ATPase [Chaenotheca gracillima]
MGKRKHEAAKAEDERLRSNGATAKKLRKEKSLKTQDDRPSNSATPEPSANEISKEERKEKKRLKKLKKLAKAHIATDQNDVASDGTTEASNAQDAKLEDVKDAQKAEKAELKALKRAKKQAKGEARESAVSSPSVAAIDEGPALKHGPTSLPSNGNGTSTNGSSFAEAYQEDSRLTELPENDINAFKATHAIAVDDPLSSTHVLRPITSFEYLPEASSSYQQHFKGFTSPTPIQAAAWPFAYAGRDVIGIAETGSGKTLAFALPCIRNISQLKEKHGRKGGSGVRAVIVSPTRELALQIHEQIEKFAASAGLGVVCIYGGVSKDDQRAKLNTASIIVATPGRLNDFINEGSADLSRVGYVVLDEADRMLDKGFEEEIRKILTTMPTYPKPQTLMFTATWPPSIRALAATFLSRPAHISIGANNPTNDLRANVRIVQKVEVVDPRGKEQRLLQLLKQYQSGAQKDDRILVFCLYKKEATRVEGFLKSRWGPNVAGIHGDLGQAQRTASLAAFKSGKVTVLVATDVAARGLDIPAVKAVINVTFPLTVEDYVHRIGRTGRAGKEGLAITLFTEHDKAQSGALINVLKAANQPVPDELLKFGTTVKKKSHDAYGAFYKDTGDSGKSAKKIKFDD